MSYHCLKETHLQKREQCLINLWPLWGHCQNRVWEFSVTWSRIWYWNSVIASLHIRTEIAIQWWRPAVNSNSLKHIAETWNVLCATSQYLESLCLQVSFFFFFTLSAQNLTFKIESKHCTSIKTGIYTLGMCSIGECKPKCLKISVLQSRKIIWNKDFYC